MLSVHIHAKEACLQSLVKVGILGMPLNTFAQYLHENFGGNRWCCSKELHEEQLQLHIQRSEVIPKQRHLAQSTCFILAAAAAVTAATFQG
eukprot:scaffold175443_cov22-Tisochrysis_lutea.AAC.1